MHLIFLQKTCRQAAHTQTKSNANIIENAKFQGKHSCNPMWRDGTEAGATTLRRLLCLSKLPSEAIFLTNDKFSLGFNTLSSPCRLAWQFFLLCIITSLASRLRQLSLLLFMCLVLCVCVCVIYRVLQQTPIISVCKQQFAPLPRRRERNRSILMGWHRKTCSDSGNENGPMKHLVI